MAIIRPKTRFVWLGCAVVLLSMAWCANDQDPIYIMDLQGVPECSSKLEYPCRTTQPLVVSENSDPPSPLLVTAPKPPGGPKADPDPGKLPIRLPWEIFSRKL